jgi:hypothetical protein
MCVLSSCANPHFFPRLHPLFPGLEEANLSPHAQNCLAQAKSDFLLLKHGEAPRHATLARTVPHSRSKVYEGPGYRLTMVREENSCAPRMGPEIMVASTITGGPAYHYDEIDDIND